MKRKRPLLFCRWNTRHSHAGQCPARSNCTGLFTLVTVTSAALFALMLCDFVLSLLFYRRHVCYLRTLISNDDIQIPNKEQKKNGGMAKSNFSPQRRREKRRELTGGRSSFVNEPEPVPENKLKLRCRRIGCEI